MNNSFNKKISEIFGKVDEKVLETKLNKALEILKSGNTDDLAKKINKIDKNELLNKINEFDEEKLKDLNLDKDEFRKKISDADLNNLSKLIGEQGDEIIRKIKDIIK